MKFCLNRFFVGLVFLTPFFIGPVFSDIACAGVEEDYAKALETYDKGDLDGGLKLLGKIADAGYAPAQARLGYILDYSEFDEDAVGMYSKAAKQGNADGAFGLGEMYAKGEGVKKDWEQAFYWFEVAADKGHLRAMRTLAKAYEKGELGMPVDIEMSKSWSEKAKALEKKAKKKKE